MRRIALIALGFLVSIAVSVGSLGAVGRTEPRPRDAGQPIGPRMAPDTGAGEQLIVVVGGAYQTRADAETANLGMAFGDLAGYYVVPVAQLQGFKEGVGAPGDFALVSVFRTEQGAVDFAGLAESLGYPATLLPGRVRSLGGVYAGLGQEAASDGSGPLTHPIPESLP